MNVKIFGLGGFGELGKNMYAISIDSKYFIIDAGLKYPSSELYGIDQIIPSFDVIKRIKNNIQGIFISNAHEEHMGALSYLLKEVPLKVYLTQLAKEVLVDQLDDDNIHYNDNDIIVINKESRLEFGEVIVEFFKTTNNIPESLGIIIKTKLGNIIYTSEFSFDQGANPLYQTDFNRINKLSGENNLAMLLEANGSVRDVQIGFDKLFNYEIDNIFQDAKGRIIFTLYSSDLLKIQKIINTCIEYNKKIAILGRKAQRLVDIAIKHNYLNIPKELYTKLFFIDPKNKNEYDPNLVVLVTGSRHEPFYMLQRMARKTDKLVHLNNNDKVVMLTPPVPGTEKIASRTLDVLARYDVKVHAIKEELLASSHASSAEVKMMINLFSPRYVIPAIGEFAHQVNVKNLAKDLGYGDHAIYVLENGDVLTYTETDVLLAKGEIPTGDILIDGTPINDKNDAIIKDRELLARDGVVILSVYLSRNENKIKSDIVIDSNGFYNPPNHDEFMLELKNNFKIQIQEMLKKPRRLWNDEKRKIRNELATFIEKKAHRKPLLIILIDEL